MKQITCRDCTREIDLPAVVDMLFAIKEDLCIPDRASAHRIVDLCFSQGGVIGVYDDQLLCGMTGYFCGEPELEFANKEIAFLYVAGILPSHRLSRVFHTGLVFALKAFQENGCAEIRLQARASDPYTNGLYARFARRLGESRSIRGDKVITYGGTVKEALNHLMRRSRFRDRSVGLRHSPVAQPIG